jgi:hypothetical protein
MKYPIHNVTRPTQGQLKWALLNQKRIALDVQSYVERLYMFPPTVADIPAYADNLRHFDNDDNTMVGIEYTNHPSIRISEGRRVLLLVSKHEYNKRKQFINNNGFRYRQSECDNESDHSIQDPNEHDNEAREIDGMPTLSTSRQDDNRSVNIRSTGRRKKFRRRRQKFQPRCSDPERVRRFKEAFQVALHSLEVATADCQSIDQKQASLTADFYTSTIKESTNVQVKRRNWIRPEVNEDLTNIGEAYTVYGRTTIPKRQPSVHNPTLTPGKAPQDRGATWLNLWCTSNRKKTDVTSNQFLQDLLSTPENTSTSINDCCLTSNCYQSILTPAVRQHVADVAREIFSGGRTGINSGDSTMQPSSGTCTSPSVYNADTLERDVTSFVNQFEEYLVIGGCDSFDMDDPAVSSPRHSNFDAAIFIDSDVASAPMGCHGTIPPVVTYDSDESKQSARNVSSIRGHKSDTFTIQELDSSFHTWNQSTILFPNEELGRHDNDTTECRTCRDEFSNDTSNTQLDSYIPIEPISPVFNASFHDMVTEEVFDFSPLNLKHFVRRLPDENCQRIIDDYNVARLPVPISSSLVTKKIKEDIDDSTNEDVTFTKKNSGMTSTVRESRTKWQTNVAQQLPQRSSHTSILCMVQHPDTNFRFSTSTGCGLYTERGQQYDVQWEKRWML